jgi:hypothetical protein
MTTGPPAGAAAAAAAARLSAAYVGGTNSLSLHARLPPFAPFD